MRQETPIVLGGSRINDPVLCAAAENLTAETLAFLVRYGSGFIRAALPEAECDRLRLPPMVPYPGFHRHRVSVDLVDGASTGISATARTRTIRALAAVETPPDAFSRPGHVLPVAVDVTGGGTDVNSAAVELAQTAGLRPAAALCELVSPQNPVSMAWDCEAVQFALTHGLPYVHLNAVVSKGSPIPWRRWGSVRRRAVRRVVATAF